MNSQKDIVKNKHKPFQNMRVVLTVAAIKINSEARSTDISTEFQILKTDVAKHLKQTLKSKFESKFESDSENHKVLKQ